MNASIYFSEFTYFSADIGLKIFLCALLDYRIMYMHLSSIKRMGTKHCKTKFI